MTIPYILYKTGPFDTITQPEIIECFRTNEKMLKSKIVYFNDKNCRHFIKQHFGPNIMKAYDMLIPSAYKADLWRLCVLYIHGGIYGDLTQTFLREYDVNKDNVDIILVKDRRNAGIYNAFMAAKKRNGFIKYCIEQIVTQILLRNRGKCPLDITGPRALQRHYLTFFKKYHTGGQEKIRGMDNHIYKVCVPFYNTSTCTRHTTITSDYRYLISNCCADLNHRCIMLNKIQNHYKLLYKGREGQYVILWKKHKIFTPNINQ